MLRVWRMSLFFRLCASSRGLIPHGFMSLFHSPCSPGCRTGLTANCLSESCERFRGEFVRSPLPTRQVCASEAGVCRRHTFFHNSFLSGFVHIAINLIDQK